MRKDFHQLTPKEILEIKEDYLWQTNSKADQSHAAEEVTDAQAEALYNDPNYPTRAEWMRALFEAEGKYPFYAPLVGKFVTNPDGTRTYQFVPKEGVLLYTEPDAKIITVTPQEERESARECFAEEQSLYHFRAIASDAPLRQIQDKLVQYNSDRLNYNDGKHDRWLEPIGVADYDYPSEGVIYAGMIYVNQRYEDQLSGQPSSNITLYSDVAALLAHELGHFINKSTMSWVEGNPLDAQREVEFRSEQTGMELLDKVPEYSMGSMAQSATGSKGLYPDEADDLRFIENWSHGRMKFENLPPLGMPFYH
jgi:hypothetical protein